MSYLKPNTRYRRGPCTYPNSTAYINYPEFILTDRFGRFRGLNNDLYNGRSADWFEIKDEPIIWEE